MRNKKLIVIFSVLCCVTMLIIVSSVVFSVQHIDAYCMNLSDEDLDDRVIKNSGISKGSSIFFVNENKLTDSLRPTVPEAKVVNIERKFPNRISINYVKLLPYMGMIFDNNYYTVSNNGRIISKSLLAPEYKLIHVKMNSSVTGQLGDSFADVNSYEFTMLNTIFESFKELGYLNECVELIDFIDLRKENYVYLQTRTGAGIELRGESRILAKLRLALSVYTEETDNQGNGNYFIANDTEPIRVDLTNENIYDKYHQKRLFTLT